MFNTTYNNWCHSFIGESQPGGLHFLQIKKEGERTIHVPIFVLKGNMFSFLKVVFSL